MEEKKSEALTPEELRTLAHIRDAMRMEDTELQVVSGIRATVPEWVKERITRYLDLLAKGDSVEKKESDTLVKRFKTNRRTYELQADKHTGNLYLYADGDLCAAADLGPVMSRLDETARDLILERLFYSAIVLS